MGYAASCLCSTLRNAPRRSSYTASALSDQERPSSLDYNPRGMTSVKLRLAVALMHVSSPGNFTASKHLECLTLSQFSVYSAFLKPLVIS